MGISKPILDHKPIQDHRLPKISRQTHKKHNRLSRIPLLLVEQNQAEIKTVEFKIKMEPTHKIRRFNLQLKINRPPKRQLRILINKWRTKV